MQLVPRNTGCQQHLLPCRCFWYSRSYLALTLFFNSVPVPAVHESQVTAGAGMGMGQRQGHSKMAQWGCSLSQLMGWPDRWGCSDTQDCFQGFPFPHPNWRSRLHLGGKQRISPPKSKSQHSPAGETHQPGASSVKVRMWLPMGSWIPHGSREMMMMVSGWLPAPCSPSLLNTRASNFRYSPKSLVWPSCSCLQMKKRNDAKGTEKWQCSSSGKIPMWAASLWLLSVTSSTARGWVELEITLSASKTEKRTVLSFFPCWNPFLRCFLGSKTAAPLSQSHKCQALGCRCLNVINWYLVGEGAVDIWQWVAKLWFQEVLFLRRLGAFNLTWEPRRNMALGHRNNVHSGYSEHEPGNPHGGG